MWVQTLGSAFLCLHVCTATPVNKNNVTEVCAPPGGGWCVFDLCVCVSVCVLACVAWCKAPLRQAYTEQLWSSAGAPEALQRRRDSEVDEWEWSREKGGGGGQVFTGGGKRRGNKGYIGAGGEQTAQIITLILRDGGRLSEGEINSEEEGE